MLRRVGILGGIFAYAVVIAFACGPDETGAPTADAGDAANDATGEQLTAFPMVPPRIDAGEEDLEPNRVKPPTITPRGGLYFVYLCVLISPPPAAPTGVKLHYTTDGGIPNAESPQFDGALVIHETTTVKAVAVAPGMQDSRVAEIAYEILPKARTTQPVAEPTPDLHDNDLTATLKAFEDTLICYTTDGGAPSCNHTWCPPYQPDTCANGAPYTGPIAVKPGTDRRLHIRSIACGAKLGPSSVTEAFYRFQVGALSITAPNGTNPDYLPTSSAQFWNGGPTADFNLQTTTESETIRYAVGTNGAVPADIGCASPCAGDSACTECTPGDGGCQTGTLQPRTNLKVVGCKPNYAPTALRRLLYADPDNP